VTTLLAAGLLFVFATGPVRGFGVTLSIGVLASMFTCLVLSRVLIESLATRPWVRRHPGLTGLAGESRTRQWLMVRRPFLLRRHRQWLAGSALALAVAVTGRRKIMVFRGGYHGGVLTFGDGPSPVTVPHEWVLADYDDVEGARALIAEHGSELAAVLVEPMLGAGGCVPAGPEFLQALRAESAAVGALLVFDEVMTSRLAPGGLQSLVGVRPDLTTLGKYLGGGLSFGAFGGRADLMAAYDPARPGSLFHAGTFNNNVLTMSAGIAGLEQVLTDDVLGAVNDRGDRLRALLDEVAAPAGLHVSGRGSLMTIHPATRPVIASEPLTDAQAAVK
jgi:glutamate-1-semialdehyde 2,1-aminomutase